MKDARLGDLEEWGSPLCVICIRPLITPGSHSLKPRSPGALTIVVSHILIIISTSCYPAFYNLISCIRTPDLSLLLSRISTATPPPQYQRPRLGARKKHFVPTFDTVPSLSSAVPLFSSLTSSANLINNVSGLSATSRTDGTGLSPPPVAQAGRVQEGMAALEQYRGYSD